MRAQPEKFYALLRAWFPRPVRLWLNGVGIAVLGYLGARGVIDGAEALALAGILGAALLVVHRANVPGRDE